MRLVKKRPVAGNVTKPVSSKLLKAGKRRSKPVPPKKTPPMPEETFLNLCRIPPEKKKRLWKYYARAYANNPLTGKAAIVYIMAANKLVNSLSKSFKTIAEEVNADLAKQTGRQFRASYFVVRQISAVVGFRPARKNKPRQQ